ncbi:MAG: DNA topoisomerase IV subunit B [Gammaproteobacteria bacterium]|nr:MAG: DNA topoisomerase IV subunit B [Gammaproteobacteria bacterium]
MSEYNAESIEVLEGLEPVQKRPGMYTDTTCPNHLIAEVVDNSVDEALQKFANKIIINLFADGSVEVDDNGRGMPVDKHPTINKSGVEVILTTLHAGGKFSDKNYQFSGGLHGVGISVVNALSENLQVKIKRDGFLYQMEFNNGDPIDELKKIDKVAVKDTGTIIRFLPNHRYFDSVKYDIKALFHLLKAKAVLCPNLHIIFYDENKDETTEWLYQGDLGDYLKEELTGIETIPEPVFAEQITTENQGLDFALCWDINKQNIITDSYVNLVPTTQGGTHVNGIKTGLIDCIKEFAVLHKLLPKGLKIVADDIWLGLNFVLSVKMAEPQFSGQTKERLTSRQISSFVSSSIKNSFSLWLNKHPQTGTQIAQNIIDNAQNRQKKSQNVVRKKIIAGPKLPGKLADCVATDLNQTELFLVEGDSAGGSTKQARDKDFQAVMPLRGKILNTWEVKSTSVLSSKEVHDIAVAIGMDPDDDDISKLRYGKICILADADSDGLHIATLLCALFVKHFNILVQKGHIFVAMPPLYRIDYGKKVRYALDDDEKNSIMNNIIKKNKNAKISTTRFKGLGEMNPPQLRETTLAPDTRRLVQMSLNNENMTTETLDMLLAKKRADDRKVWLEESGNLAIV